MANILTISACTSFLKVCTFHRATEVTSLTKYLISVLQDQDSLGHSHLFLANVALVEYRLMGLEVTSMSTLHPIKPYNIVEYIM